MKLLVADDDPLVRTLLSRSLGKLGYEIVLAEDGSIAWQILEHPDAPRLAIIDWMMPGVDGPELCRRLRIGRNHFYTYVILLTSRNQRGDVLDGLNAGADDYLRKPVDLAELEARLRVGRRIIDLHQQLLHECEAREYEASHDVLTGIWNRRAILELLTREQAKSARSQKKLAMLLVDIDHFKVINDVHGHLAGDTVLQQMAQRMLSSLRPYDLLGRYGGEEFLVIAPDCGDAGGLVVAERLRQAVVQKPFQIETNELKVTVSVGVTVWQDPKVTECEVLRDADSALYQAKANGRNRVELFRGTPEPEPGDRRLPESVRAQETTSVPHVIPR